MRQRWRHLPRHRHYGHAVGANEHRARRHGRHHRLVGARAEVTADACLSTPARPALRARRTTRHWHPDCHDDFSETSSSREEASRQTLRPALPRFATQTHGAGPRTRVLHRRARRTTMGTGPRGGRRVREAAEAAARRAAAAAETAAPETAAPDDAPAAKRPKGDPAPAPKTGGSVDPEDVDRKSTQMLVKKGYAEAAVARAMAATRPTADDLSQSFNEQKRRRTAAASSGSPPTPSPGSSRPAPVPTRARPPRTRPPRPNPGPCRGRGRRPRRAGQHEPTRSRPRREGSPPIAEEHVLREPRVRTNEETARAVPMVGGAGAGAQGTARARASLPPRAKGGEGGATRPPTCAPIGSRRAVRTRRRVRTIARRRCLREK